MSDAEWSERYAKKQASFAQRRRELREQIEEANRQIEQMQQRGLRLLLVLGVTSGISIIVLILIYMR